MPRLHDPAEDVLYILREELLENLKVTLTGCSSSLHIWNPISERFEVPPAPGVQRTVIIMIGMDEAATNR